jgi:hypothetical protein
MIEDKLTKCKDKKECFEVIKEHLESMFSAPNNMKLTNLLYNTILVYTSEFLEGKRDPESYERAIDRVLGKYKECSKNPEELLLKVEDVRKGILKAYSRIKDLPGECDYWDEIIRGVKEMGKKEEYVI